MGFEDDLIAAGAKKIVKKRFFVEVDDNNNPKGVPEEVPTVDINGNPIQPHVWVPPGKSFSCYNEDDETVIKRKIKNKETPLVVITKEKIK